MINESTVLIQNKKKFQNKKVLFSGNIQDEVFLFLNTKKYKIHIQRYYDENLFQKISKKNICFRSLPKKKYILSSNVLIFFWIKNKIEAKFQLTHLLSTMKINSEIFIVGRNIFGIRSIQKIFKNWVLLHKIDYKKKCTLYYGIIKKKNIFIFKNFIKKYIIFGIIIFVLPGLFDYKGIDQGSLLMIQTFQKINISSKVLDIGAGSGILSIALKKINPMIKITLIDNNSTALLCSKYNLKKNNMQGRIFYSNLYSQIKEKFHLIISNPPTHYGINNDYNMIYKIIKKAKNFLYKKGRLRIVIHSHIPCKRILNNCFGNYKIITFHNHFNVYESILN